MIQLVRVGASYGDAAKAVSYTERVVKEWLARGLGLSQKPSTPRLREFAMRMEQARAEAVVTAKVDLKGKSPKAWIDLNERDDKEEAIPAASPEEIIELVVMLLPHLFEDPTFVILKCPNRRCRCAWHRNREEKQ